jgi:hypothetical protein
LRLTVGAADDESKLKFLKSLESAPEFSQIKVFSESLTDSAASPDRIMLSLEATYSAT